MSQWYQWILSDTGSLTINYLEIRDVSAQTRKTVNNYRLRPPYLSLILEWISSNIFRLNEAIQAVLKWVTHRYMAYAVPSSNACTHQRTSRYNDRERDRVCNERARLCSQ